MPERAKQGRNRQFCATGLANELAGRVPRLTDEKRKPSMEVGSMRHCQRMRRSGVGWRARAADTAKTDGGGKARRSATRIGIVMLAVLAASPALAQSSLPDHQVTPGAVNPVVTPGTVGRTICRRGWTRTVRPPEQTSQEMKRTVMAAYGHAGERLSGYEGDHLVPLALGGAPTDLRNYWPEPLDPPDGWTAEMKNELEAILSRMVCSRRLPLDVAQRAIAADWHQAYQLYVLGGD
jgi:hypothetical protein